MSDYTTTSSKSEKKLGVNKLSQFLSVFYYPPKTKYTDFFENARFNLSWSILNMLSVSLVGLLITFLFTRIELFFMTLLSWSIVVVLQITLYRTRRYKVAAYTFAYVGTIFCLISLFYFKTEVHYNDALWSLAILLFAFFTLPFIQSIILFTAYVVSYVIFISFFLQGNINQNINFVTDKSIFSLAINFTIASFMIGFIISQYIRIFKKAQRKAIENNHVLKDQNKMINAQHEEKSVMLKEIHHRVKNNLQVITSLLRLQSKEVDDPKSLESFNDAINRVVAMSMIHEKIYKNKALGKIDIKQYLSQLIDDLIQSNTLTTPVETTIVTDITNINQEKLVPFALIVNELVTNSVKHAFKGKKQGKIIIHLATENNELHFEYQDNGQWVHKFDEEYSFGLEMIDILTDQLDGIKSLDTSKNTKYRFSFPN